MTKNFKRYMVPGLAMFLLLSGIAFAKEASKPKYSGYLSDYSKLQSDPDKSAARIYRNQDIDITKYKRILLERIVVVLKDDAAYKVIDPKELAALTDYFRLAISRELGTEYPLVDEPGPDVLRVRIAITGLVPTKTEMSVVTLAIPFATVPDLASGTVTEGGTGSAPYLGYAAIEAEGLDSVTLQQVFSYVEQKYPKKYDVDTSKGISKAVTKGYGQYFKSYKAWAYTKDAFDYWAKKFRNRLDAAHGKIRTEEKQ